MATVSEVLGKLVKQYEQGAGYGAGEKALLKRTKTKAMADVGQQLASAGLSGTSVGAGASQRWEEEIGMPTELRLEDMRTERLMSALLAKAGYQREEESEKYRFEFQSAEALKQRQFQAQESSLARNAANRNAMTSFRPTAQAYSSRTPAASVITHNVSDFSIPTTGTGTRSAPETFTGQEVFTPSGRGAVYSAGDNIAYTEPPTTQQSTRTPLTSAVPGYETYKSNIRDLGGTNIATADQFRIINQRLKERGMGY